MHKWRGKHKFEQIRSLLQEHYPTLHLMLENGRWLIRGSFPVKANGVVVDHYLIEILIVKGFPQSTPLVKELGGRIKRHPDWHVYQEGYLCLYSPLERWKHLPENATIVTFLEGALNDYFFSQTYFERYNCWPFGERSHGGLGIKESLSEELGMDDVSAMRQLLRYLSKKEPKGHWMCFCGSDKKMRQCHLRTIMDLRKKITVAEAQHALAVLDLMIKVNSATVI